MANSCMTVTEQDGVKIVEFADGTELDALHTEQVQPQLYALVEGGQGGRLLLDMANVRYTSSVALGCLVSVRLKAARAGCSIGLAAIPTHLVDIMNLTQLDKLYDIYPTRAAGLTALKGG
jgi:anti-anti-sigma factor